MCGLGARFLYQLENPNSYENASFSALITGTYLGILLNIGTIAVIHDIAIGIICMSLFDCMHNKPIRVLRQLEGACLFATFAILYRLINYS